MVKEEWILLIVFSFAILGLCGGLWFYTNFKIDATKNQLVNAIDEYEKKAKEEKEEVLEKGEKLDALIVDKSSKTNSSAGTVSSIPTMIGGTMVTMGVSSPGTSSTYYTLKIYADEKNYDITVPKNLYNQKQIGSYIKIKLYKDKVELLEGELD
ncbi:hypothetical protein [Bacillus paralicheniformis]|uniref:hypothetical protein n=1 Tax=Bacillus paralicheniformis TaxID=1648923 RepID=UPI001FD71D45|nr:hypothetical protein [Bacillus paralicheniformis]MCJ8223695.1 hypothetical protein [Bacillus paralicheniformis]